MITIHQPTAEVEKTKVGDLEPGVVFRETHCSVRYLKIDWNEALRVYVDGEQIGANTHSMIVNLEPRPRGVACVGIIENNTPVSHVWDDITITIS